MRKAMDLGVRQALGEMTKQFGITTFAVLYALLIAGATVEHSNAWAIRQAATIAHSGDSEHSPGISKTVQSETYLSHKKRVESEFAVELPREAVLVPVEAGRHIPLPITEYHGNRSGQPFLSRSPPVHV
jgi:hypothetical protein